MNTTEIPVDISQAELVDYIIRGAASLTPSDVHRLVAEMPELRERFARLHETPYADTERQLWLLSEVVERVWTHTYLDLPYGVALEAAFALAYFVRETDLVPDVLGTIGLIDDIAVVQIVIARHADVLAAFCEATKLDGRDFNLVPRH